MNKIFKYSLKITCPLGLRLKNSPNIVPDLQKNTINFLYPVKSLSQFRFYSSSSEKPNILSISSSQQKETLNYTPNKNRKSKVNLKDKKWNDSWSKKFKKYINLGEYTPDLTDRLLYSILKERNLNIKMKYKFNNHLAHSKLISYNFNKNINKINLDSLYKVLKSFFNSFSTLISFPSLEVSPDKLKIHLFYYIKPNKDKTEKQKKYQNFIRYENKLFKEKILRRIFKKVVTKFKMKLFIAKWKEENNLIRIPDNIERPFSVFGKTTVNDLSFITVTEKPDSLLSPHQNLNLSFIHKSLESKLKSYPSNYPSSAFFKNELIDLKLLNEPNIDLYLFNKLFGLPYGQKIIEETSPKTSELNLDQLSSTIPNSVSAKINANKLDKKSDLEVSDSPSLSFRGGSSVALNINSIITIIEKGLQLIEENINKSKSNLRPYLGSLQKSYPLDLPTPKNGKILNSVHNMSTWRLRDIPIDLILRDIISERYKKITRKPNYITAGDAEGLKFRGLDNSSDHYLAKGWGDESVKDSLNKSCPLVIIDNVKTPLNISSKIDNSNLQIEKSLSKITLKDIIAIIKIEQTKLQYPPLFIETFFKGDILSNILILHALFRSYIRYLLLEKKINTAFVDRGAKESQNIYLGNIKSENLQTKTFNERNPDSVSYPGFGSTGGHYHNLIANVPVSLSKLRANNSNLPTMVSLNKEKFKYFISFLEKYFKKTIILDLVRLKYPYHESNILVQVLGLSSKRKNFFHIIRKLLYTVSLPSKHIRKTVPKTFSIIPSYISGIKVRLGGRLLTQKIIPRFTVQSNQMGTLARTKVNFKETSRVTMKNKRGAYSFTVTASHIFFKEEKVKELRKKFPF